MTTIAPSKLILVCTKTGKAVVWTNRKIIQKKIDQFGSLEAFVAQFTCRGANKESNAIVKETLSKMKPILEEGVAIGKMTPAEYQAKYMTPKVA